jgi:hypothetical protein
VIILNDNIKKAFDGIHAEESLKHNTLDFLRTRMATRVRKNHRVHFRRFSVAMACCMVLVCFSLFSYNLYFREAMYVDVDINPSVELTVNCFDRVIDVYAYNSDGEALLEQLNLMHKKYDMAVTTLTDASMQNGFLADGGLVSVTLQSNSSTNKETALQTLETDITHSAQSHHVTVQVNATVVDSETRAQAHEQNLSPAKYLAILNLQAVDPTASIENCRDHTIEEIYTLTQDCVNGHHQHRHGGNGHE